MITNASSGTKVVLTDIYCSLFYCKYSRNLLFLWDINSSTAEDDCSAKKHLPFSQRNPRIFRLHNLSHRGLTSILLWNCLNIWGESNETTTLTDTIKFLWKKKCEGMHIWFSPLNGSNQLLLINNLSRAWWTLSNCKGKTGTAW